MNDVAIHVEHVWKKFRKGQLNDRMRDFFPMMRQLMLGPGKSDAVLGDREFWALRDVSFSVKRGQSLGVVGPNGAGKSTMLKMLARILRPNRGVFDVRGRVSSLIEVGAGFHHELTGRENIYLSGTILGMSRKEICAREQAIIEFSEVEEFMETPVKRYSSGMKARLGFSIAAHLEPDVLLVDEVLSVGDVRFRQKCLRHMELLSQSNVTIIFISHMLDQVRRLCPNTVVLDQGKAIYNGPTEEATRVYLDVFNQAPSHSEDADDRNRKVELRDISFRNIAGDEVGKWIVRQPGMIDCRLVIKERIEKPAVVIKIFDIRGMYLDTTGSASGGLIIPSEPGQYRVRFTLEPMPLTDGDYAFHFYVYDRSLQVPCIWELRQPRMLSVRGGNIDSSVVDCSGRWELTGLDDSSV